MKRVPSLAIASALSVAAVAGVFAVTTPAAAQYVAPPVEVIATVVPVYHEGHPTYWYHGYWHWRDAHGAWAHYEVEPGYLRDWRVHHVAEYRHYR
jgi:hypothetical protein